MHSNFLSRKRSHLRLLLIPRPRTPGFLLRLFPLSAAPCSCRLFPNPGSRHLVRTGPPEISVPHQSSFSIGTTYTARGYLLKCQGTSSTAPHLVSLLCLGLCCFLCQECSPFLSVYRAIGYK